MRWLAWFRWWRIRKDSQHPVRSSTTERLNFYQAQQICSTCPVIIHCRKARRDLEKQRREAHPGVWAGELWAIRHGNVKQPTRARRIA